MFWFKFKKKLKLFYKKDKHDLVLSFEKKEKLENILGFEIEDETYFLKALTHRSVLESVSSDIKSNERLE